MLYVRLLALPQRPEYSLRLTYAPIEMKDPKGSKFQKILNILGRITATYAMRYNARRRCPTCILYASWTPTTPCCYSYLPWLGSGVYSSSAFWWRYAKLLGLVQHISPPISIWKERSHMIRGQDAGPSSDGVHSLSWPRDSPLISTASPSPRPLRFPTSLP